MKGDWFREEQGLVDLVGETGDSIGMPRGRGDNGFRGVGSGRSDEPNPLGT